MKQLIDTLIAQDPPGRLVEVFQFQGTQWALTRATLDGKQQQASEGERQSILIAAESAWIAHTFVNCHVQDMELYKITSQGRAWLAPDIDAVWTPTEYRHPLEAADSEQNNKEEAPVAGDKREEEEQKSCN